MDIELPDLARPRPAGPRGPEPEPLWREVVGEVLRRERQAQQRTLRDVADAARISMPYLSELERGRKEGSSEILAATAAALGLSIADLLGLVQLRLGTYDRAAGTAAGVGSGVGTSARAALALAA